MKYAIFAGAAVAVAASPVAAQTVTYNANPSTPFSYGSGNDYTPANAAVLQNGSTELAARFHVAFAQALPSDSNGVYTFALGTQEISFDYGIWGVSTGTVTLTNARTGGTASFDIGNFFFPTQGSQRLRFGFLNGGSIFGDVDFDANVDNTYRFDLTAGGNTLTTFAQVGAGFAAVPEPSTWALFILGFGLVGGAMRRRATAKIAFA